jgi:hypothetical protein
VLRAANRVASLGAGVDAVEELGSARQVEAQRRKMVVPVRVLDDYLHFGFTRFAGPITRFFAASSMTPAGSRSSCALRVALTSKSDFVLVKKKSSRMNSSKCFAVCSAISLHRLAMLGVRIRERLEAVGLAHREGDAAGHRDAALA